MVRNCLCPLYPPTEGDDLVLFLGPDQHGVPLEVVGVELANGDLLVIHAVKLRRGYIDAYVRVMACREE